jgi:uncharacterized damage-inducible protein DinB
MAFTTFPDTDEYGAFYEGYVSKAVTDDIKAALRENRDELLNLFAPLKNEKMEYRYREGAWNLKELIQHITDSERVFAYRAMCIARGDEGPFPGYDQNDYASSLHLSEHSKEQLVYDFVMNRNAVISMLNNLREPEWERTGIASGTKTSVRALAHIMLGHCKHHMAVIGERYL